MLSAFLNRWCSSASRCTALRARFATALRLQQQRFLGGSAQENAHPPSAVTDAFPFLSKHSPAEASHQGSFGAFAATTANTSANLTVIRDMEAFEAEVYRQPPHPLAIFFAAKCNTNSKQLLEQFAGIARSAGSNAKFLVVDVNEVPRAAYSCGVSKEVQLCPSTYFAPCSDIQIVMQIKCVVTASSNVTMRVNLTTRKPEKLCAFGDPSLTTAK